MNPTNKKVLQASVGLFVLLAFQVSAHSAPPDHAKVKAAAEACAAELGIDVPPPPPHHGPHGGPPPPPPSADSTKTPPSKETMDKFDACMTTKGFPKPPAPPKDSAE